MRNLPYSAEAEMVVLGTLLVYPDAVKSLPEYHMRLDDFYVKSHQTIFQRMVELDELGRLIEAKTLVDRLRDFQELDVIGGIPYLAQITDHAATVLTLKHYVDVVQEKAQIRRLIEAGQNIAEKGFDTTNALNDVLDFAESTILDVTRIRRTTDMIHSRDVVNEFLINLERIRTQKDAITGIKTGYRSLNKITNGLQRGDLIILAARPSVGKTAFALNLALNAALHNRDGKSGIAIFSLEMPATHLMSRMISAKSSVQSGVLRSGQLNDAEMNGMHQAAHALAATNIYIDDSSTITVPEIFTKCRKLKAEGNLDLIVIDYIQLITGRGSNESRQQEVSEISRGLKQLAREMECPVVALSQLSRSVEKREVKIPQLSDLRESGSIEQDADIVMFLYREAYYETDQSDDNTPPSDTQEVLVKIAKHRNGALADVTMQFNASISKFFDVEQERGF